ncbi:MAG: heme o synthase [Bacteroidales bacterium]|nr:heme o synthase [Bacteroidales bacterium]
MATAEPTTSPIRPPVGLPTVGFADYLELTKPRIAMMALITVGAGYLLGAAPTVRVDLLLHTLIGSWLVAAGGGALNHWLERRADAKMWRTSRRPIPAGRIPAPEALSFGLSLSLGGVAYLAYSLPSLTAAITAFFTFTLYVCVYTPLKRVTTWNTVIGAIPGALPPVIGWTAATGDVTAGALSLFAILFVWQLPHFYSIAWLHRDDYARGGMVMLPIVDHADGRLTGRATVGTCLLLIVVTATPYFTQVGGWLYLLGAMPVSVWFLARAIRFARTPDAITARGVLRGSLVYLCGVMALLVLDGLLPLYL